MHQMGRIRECLSKQIVIRLADRLLVYSNHFEALEIPCACLAFHLRRSYSEETNFSDAAKRTVQRFLSVYAGPRENKLRGVMPLGNV